ncbi:hypothetical protein [Streptomyces sp. NRRL S-813]|uniref:hypothetical protein n=1 Tax=Streptomyces sp. NRRL S-813 TaxID=1463919 RepID=UPI0004C187AE|nr:hypothetical protein [Streptomyces sp. NRRL S-813]
MTGEGSTFYGPAAAQFGNHNTMHNHYTVQERSPLDAAADELARVVRAQWQEEAGLRRLLDPAPLPVRWWLATRKVTGGGCRGDRGGDVSAVRAAAGPAGRHT